MVQDLGRASVNGFPVTSLWIDLASQHTGRPVSAQQSVHSGPTLSVGRKAEDGVRRGRKETP